MDHRGKSLQFLRNTGLIPIKVRPKGKDTFPEWDPRKATVIKHDLTLIELERHPEYNMAALFSGKFVDVDVDTLLPEVYVALDRFLNATPFVWGRGAKTRAHRVYLLHDDFDRTKWAPILQYMKKLTIGGRKYSVELLGGRPESNFYAVLPGSIHPDGDPYLWADDIDPTVSTSTVKDTILIKQMRMALAAALMSAYWQEGMRNDISMALSGLFWRIRAAALATYDAEDDDELAAADGFVLTKEDCKALLTVIMECANDDAADQRARLLTFENTWRKLETDPAAKVTGGKALAEMIGEEGPDVVKALYRLLCDSEGIDQFEELSERFVLWYGPGVMIDIDLVQKGIPTCWMTKDQTTNSLGDKKLRIGGNRIPLAKLLFSIPIIQRVYGLTFDPSTTDNIVSSIEGTKVNQWQGFATEPYEQPVPDKDMEPLTEYIHEILANGDERMAEWITNWVADIFQDPAHKAKTALVLVGQQGAGKTFLGEHVIRPLVGSRHSVAIASASSITDKFNQIVDNKIFVQCDEALHQWERTVSDKLKSIISDDTITVEPKGINAFKKPCHMRLLFTSNNENTPILIDASSNERRFTVSQVSDKRARDLAYWAHMIEWTAANRPKIMRWLLDRKYDKKTIMRPVDTEAKRAIQRVGMEAELAWIIARLSAGFPLEPSNHKHWFEAFNASKITEKQKLDDELDRTYWPDSVMLNALEDDYKRFVRAHGRPVYSGSVLTNIKKVLPVGSLAKARQMAVEYRDDRTMQKTKTRVRVYTFPTIEAIKAHLKLIYGGIVDAMLEGVEEEDLKTEDKKPAKPKSKAKAETREY